jgi:hypothetical protein
LDKDEKEVYFLAYECQDNGRLSQIHRINNDYSELSVDDFDYTGNNATLKMDMEDISSPIQDSSGYNNDGVYNGSLYSQVGIYGDSLAFDGVDDNILVSDSASLNISDKNFTISAWVNFDVVTGTKDYMVVDKGDGTTGYLMQIDGRNIYNSRLNCKVNSQTSATADIPATAGQWYHIACVYNGTHIVNYWNGTEYQATAYSTDVAKNSNDLTIGSDNTLLTDHFDGRIDQVVIFEEALTPTEINEIWDTFRSTNVLSKVFLTKDNEDVFRVFYQYQEPATGTYSIRTLGNFGDFACTDWVAQDICEYDQQKFTRTCVPEDAESNTTYWATTTYCSKQYNESAGIYQQGYEDIYISDTCNTDWEEVPGVESCRLAKEIPHNCENISVEVQGYPAFEGREGCDDGNYTLTICNPDLDTDCISETFNCEYFNGTLIKEYTDYVAGEWATGRVVTAIESTCRCPLFFGRWIPFGITRFRAEGTLRISCVAPYETGWNCQGNYEVFQNIDGTPSNETYCDYGCNEDTGRCISSQDAVSEGSTAIGFEFWNEFFTNPSPTQKLIQAIFGMLLVGGTFTIIAGAFGLDKRHLFIAFILGFAGSFIFFVSVGYIPGIWVAVLIIFGGLGFYLKAQGNR